MPCQYLLKNYVGLDNKVIKSLYDIDSRFITITRGYPQIIYGERDIVFLKDLEKF